MESFNKILFPVDLSEASRLVAPYVNMMVDQFGAESHVIHVVHFTDYYSSLEEPIPSVKGYVNEITHWAEGKIQQFIDENMSPPPVATKLIVGRPGDEILDYAESKGIDLIIMAHSQTRFGRLIFGSVARNVVKRASMPTMIVNPNMLRGKIKKSDTA
jgi:nucleotide-binding universal stress UspA family protein